MVTLHELDFPSLRVTDLQSADGGNTQNLLRDAREFYGSFKSEPRGSSPFIYHIETHYTTGLGLLLYPVTA
jgi:hypothetical protein